MNQLMKVLVMGGLMFVSGNAAAVSVESLEVRVAKLEDGIGVARKSFSANVQRWRNGVLKSKLSPDMKRTLISSAEQELKTFEWSSELPDHPP